MASVVTRPSQIGDYMKLGTAIQAHEVLRKVKSVEACQQGLMSMATRTRDTGFVVSSEDVDTQLGETVAYLGYERDIYIAAKSYLCDAIVVTYPEDGSKTFGEFWDTIGKQDGVRDIVFAEAMSYAVEDIASADTSIWHATIDTLEEMRDLKLRDLVAHTGIRELQTYAMSKLGYDRIEDWLCVNVTVAAILVAAIPYTHPSSVHYKFNYVRKYQPTYKPSNFEKLDDWDKVTSGMVSKDISGLLDAAIQTVNYLRIDNPSASPSLVS